MQYIYILENLKLNQEYSSVANDWHIKNTFLRIRNEEQRFENEYNWLTWLRNNDDAYEFYLA